MQTAKTLRFCSPFVVLAAVLAICVSALAPPAPAKTTHSAATRLKIEAEQGELIGPAIDCDGDGISNDSRIDFDGDGIPDECIEGREEVPEPPFEQTYKPTSEEFYSLLPPVGWSARYECGSGLYDVTLSRPEADRFVYSAGGVTLTSGIVYDDIDPNLNQPLIIRDPISGIRYSFNQEREGEFYEYALADYDGSVGLYVYETGEQLVAAPCTPLAE